MAFTFHELPPDLCKTIIGEWVPKSMCAIDFAFCNHALRPLYMSWMADIPMRLDIPHDHGNTEKNIMWCALRRVRLQSLYLSIEDEGFEDGFEQLLSILQDLYPNLLVHVRVLNCSQGENIVSIAKRLWPFLPAVVELSFNCLTLVDGRTAIQFLPHPEQLQDLTVTTVDELDEPSVPADHMFWTRSPQLQSLELSLNSNDITAGAWLSLYESWTTLSSLRKLCLTAKYSDLSVEVILPHPFPLLPSLNHLEHLELSYIDDYHTWSIIAVLLQHCPALQTLRLTENGFLLPATALFLLQDVSPRLKSLQWVESDVELSVSVPDGHTLASLMQRREDFTAQELKANFTSTIYQLAFLSFLKPMEYRSTALPCPYKAFMSLPGNSFDFEVDNPFWTRFLLEPNFITDLELCGVEFFVDGAAWAQLLVHGCLHSLQIRRCTQVQSSFASGVQRCAAMGWTSKLQKLWIQDDTKENLFGLSSLVAAVFPSLQHVTYQVGGSCTDTDLMCLLRLPQLHSLAIGGLPRNSLLTLESISAEAWEMLSAGSRCAEITLALTTPEPWTAFQRFLDSSLGRRLTKVTIHSDNHEQWSQALAVHEVDVRYPRQRKIEVMNYLRGALLCPDFTIPKPL